MINFFNKNNNNNNQKESNLIKKTASLLIHAAKIDENYTEKEKEIIKKTLIELGAEKENINKLFAEAEIEEKMQIRY